ncbi:hypothetical protein [Ectobacillus panaciterrae]|uniref:hypothetical protein n=1 Tax=Ectobacillus panaciterrae TaxID=363872 RepID=UPI00042A490D|nr:hypothetical protein [Ectobacillus panaciterrae]
MNKHKLRRIFFASLLVMCIFNISAYAAPLEDEDLPISFRLEILPWEKVDDIIPNRTIFTIIDVETGLRFKVQRRAGSSHIDAQPLTHKDTRIMKKIFSGDWSWKRRAIVVFVNDQLIAASMHGMPHGAGALQNGFPGHFCVHFYGSTTHRSHHEDLAHKIMILKAGGKFDEYVSKVDPYELINIFALTVHNSDPKLMDLVVSNERRGPHLHETVQELKYFRIRRMPEPPLEDINGLFSVNVPVQVDMWRKKGKLEKRIVQFIVRRDNLTDRWKIDGDSLYEELNRTAVKKKARKTRSVNE